MLKFKKMKCKVCQKEKVGSEFLGVCRDCILNNWEKAKGFAQIAHQKSRKEFSLPEKIPKAENGLKCVFCANQCQIGEGEFGFCGLRKNENGKLISFVSNKKALFQYYFDLLPTNCVAASWCNAEEGKYNLAVFLGACNLNCLFCQNWNFKYLTKNLSPIITQENLLKAIHGDVHCICFFGGDPGPQLPFIIEFCKKARRIKKDLRFCLETNGIENSDLLKEFAQISFESNGIIKFDLKYFNEKLSLALSGVSNKRAFENFKILSKMNSKQIVASTLLIPGYINEEEVSQIAKFIAKLDKNILYALLAFYPCFKFSDLPTTSWTQAQSCFKAAKDVGLKNVRIGNVHLLR